VGRREYDTRRDPTARNIRVHIYTYYCTRTSNTEYFLKKNRRRERWATRQGARQRRATRLEIRPVATLGREGGEVPKYLLLLRLENLGAHVQYTTTHTMVSAAHTLISRYKIGSAC
jgi:hypothetical protein